MNTYMILGLTALTIIIVIGILYYGIPYLKSKNVPVENVLDKVSIGIDNIDNALTSINNVAPIPYFSLIDKIFDYAKIAVNNAERLYKIGNLDKNERKENAKQYVEDVLKVANIDVNDDLKKVIDGAIEAGVEVLPKTHQ